MPQHLHLPSKCQCSARRRTVVQAGAIHSAWPAAQPLVPIHQIPTLADAFAVLLAAEKGEVIPSWPADEIVEQVTKRILDQLSDRVVRETVADV